MTCDEVQGLQGPYLDSELDARATLELEHHLKGCPDCARVFAEEQQVLARLKASLNRGQRTAGLWDRMEDGIRAGGHQRSQVFPGSVGPGNLCAALSRWKDSWSAPRWIWAGLTAMWAIILVLSTTARETEQAAAPRRAPSASELRFALKQKQLWMAELAAPSAVFSANSLKAVPPGPRTEQNLVNLHS